MKYYIISLILCVLLSFYIGGYKYQNHIQVKIKLNPGAQIPYHGTEYSAGYDLYSNENCTINIFPKQTRMIMTGIRLEIPNDHYVQIVGRSSLAKKSIIIGAGIIDADYRGEIGVLLTNLSPNVFIINKGDRIGQMILKRYYPIDFVITNELSETVRGEGGFGSTGK